MVGDGSIAPVYRWMSERLKRDLDLISKGAEPTEIWKAKDATAAGIDKTVIRSLICKRDPY